VPWRAEYEPYGNVYAMRAGARTDQPLRFPGQELAMTWEGAEENYNIFRWYRAGWGRYTQFDTWYVSNFPRWMRHGVSKAFLNPFEYASGNPISLIDPYGLETKKQCVAKYTLISAGLGGMLGGITVSATGALAGSTIPGPGTAVGAIIGWSSGNAAGGAIGGAVGGTIVGTLVCSCKDDDAPPDNILKFPKPSPIPPDGQCDYRWAKSLAWIQENVFPDSAANAAIGLANAAYINCKNGLPTIFPGGF